MVVVFILVYTVVAVGACTLYVYECAKHPQAAKYIASLSPYYRYQETLCSEREQPQESEDSK